MHLFIYLFIYLFSIFFFFYISHVNDQKPYLGVPTRMVAEFFFHPLLANG